MNYFSGGFPFSFDILSLFFLGVTALVSLPAALYGTGYLKGEYSKAKSALQWALFAGFVLSMAAVVSVNNAFLFLVAWEVMSLLSYFLVIFETKHEQAVRAGTIYIVMTHIGTAFITAAFLVLYAHAGSFEFSALKEAAQALPSGTKNVVFLCFFVGFGTKAGIVPLHVWLPYAHPQAPSHVSSLMSGVMVKMAVYGILRFIVGMLGVPSLWWGYTVLGFAVMSCIIGVMYALTDHNIKRLLAYSTVENMGIILLGIGASMTFSAYGLAVPAALALIAALYHLVNHAVFKGLLFFGAGAVLKATGTKSMEKMGGLIKKMPWTAAFFLIGSLAISGVPPFNGFVGEWLAFQALFAGVLGVPGVEAKIVLTLCAAALALTGGLAAACFVKAFGITFLAMPRSAKAEEAQEAPLSMRIPMGFLALLTLGLGLAAPVMVKALTRVAQSVSGAAFPDVPFLPAGGLFAVATGPGSSLSPALLFACLCFVALAAAAAVYLGFGKSRVRTGRTWGCGYYELDSRTEYTSTAFSKPFRLAFSFLLLPYRKKEKIMETQYYIKSFRYEVYTTPVFRRFLYRPFLDRIFRTARFVRRLQPGSIHLYIAYIFATILLLIMFMNGF